MVAVKSLTTMGIEGMNIVVSIPKEYTRKASHTDDAVVLDMPAIYAGRLCGMICDGIETVKQDQEGKIVGLG